LKVSIAPNMGIIDRLQKAVSAPMDVEEVKPKKAPAKRAAKATDVKTDVKDAKEEPKDTKTASATKVVPAHLLGLLSRPHVSEKAARLGAQNTYVFDVALTAEKIAIKKAVEALYNVKVIAVRTVRGIGKPVRRGRRASARADWKKALVTLAPGQKMDLYEGV